MGNPSGVIGYCPRQVLLTLRLASFEKRLTMRFATWGRNMDVDSLASPFMRCWGVRQKITWPSLF